MSLRELINSVDSELYSDNALYQMLRETRPEYGASRHFQVNVVNGEIAITNCHVGSLGDPITDGRLNLGTWQGIYFCEYRNFLNLSPTKPCPTSPAMRSKCWNSGGVGDKS